MIESIQWRDRVGVVVEERRIRLGFRSIRSAAAAAGVSEGAWRQLESGKRVVGKGITVAPNPSRRTKIMVSTILEWPEDIFDRLLHGELTGKG